MSRAPAQRGGVSLDRLLADPALELRLLSPGPAPQPPVTWVAPTDLRDPTPFLSGGELVLTTGPRLEDERDAWDAYVGRLVRRRVSAVGFGTGVVHQGVPQGLVAAARAASLALVEVPRHVPFVHLTRAVADAVIAEQYAHVHQASRLASRLAQRVAAGGRLSDLLAEIADAVGGEVALVDAAGDVLAGHPSGAAWPLADLVRRAGSAAPDAGTHLVPLQRFGGPDHVLVARTGDRGPAAAALLEAAAPLLSVDLARQLEGEGARAAQVEMLLAALRDWTTPTASLARVVRVAGLAADAPTVLVVLRCAPGDAPAAGWSLRLVVEEHAAAVRQGRAGDRTVLVLQGAPGGGAGPDPEQLLAAVEARMPRRGVVVAGPAQDVEHLRLVLAGALALSERAEVPSRAPALDLGAVVAAAAGRGGRDAAAAFLAPLVAHDAAHELQLLPTLRVHLECDAQPGRTMVRLHVHRNTLRYRLAKVEALLGVDLSDLGALTTCRLALAMAEL